MKLLKKLIPILTVASTTAVALPFTTSCSKTSDNEVLKNKAIEILANYYEWSVAYEPEARGKIESIYTDFFDYIVEEKSGYKCYGASILGSGAMESVARQPEAENIIKACINITFPKIKKYEEYKAIGYGQLGAQATIGIARQPEVEAKITSAVKFTNSEIKKSKNFDQATALGLAGGCATKAIAYQPYADDKIMQVLSDVSDSIQELDSDSTLKRTKYPWNVSLALYDEYDQEGYLIWEPWINHDTLQTGYNYSSGKAIDVGVIGALTIRAIAKDVENESIIKKNMSLFIDLINKCSDIEKTRFLGSYGAETSLCLGYQPGVEKDWGILHKILLPAISQPYIDANLTRARELEMIMNTFNRNWFLHWDTGDIDKMISATKVVVEYIPKIVEIGSDTKAHNITTLSTHFILEARLNESTDYETLKKQYLDAINEIIK